MVKWAQLDKGSDIMATTGTETVRALVGDALLDIEAGTMGFAAESEAMAHGVRHLNRIMKVWARMGYLQYLVTSQSVTVVADATFLTMSPVRPIEILNARYKDASGIEIPMNELSRQEYDELPQKTTSGIPTNFYYDRQKEVALLYIWPTLAAVTTETIALTFTREPEDIADEDDVIDIPAEGYDAVVKNLAYRLSPAYGTPERRLVVREEAKVSLDTWLAADSASIIRFRDDF